MPWPEPQPDDAGPLESFLRRAIWRVRLERMRRAVGLMVYVLLAGAIAWTAAILVRPEWALGVPIGLGVAALLLFVAVDAALFWQVDRRRVLLRMDRQLLLKDAVISSSELVGEGSDGWRERQVEQTIARLRQRPWGELWPARWPRFTGVSALTLLFFAGVLWLNYFVAESAARPVPNAFVEAQMQALEQVFKDWEEAEKKFDDPELRRLLEELKPLREKIAAGQLKEKEALVALSRVEEKLEAARKSLEAQSIESSAAELAAALEPLQNMSAMAAALRRKDFGQAEKLAAEQAEQLAKPEAKLPQGAESPANQQRMANLAKNLQERGQEQVSAAMQQMCEGMKQGDAKKMSEGMSGLKQGLGKQAKRDGEKQRLRTQLAQMGQCKECMGNGQSLGRGMSLMPKLSMEKKEGGKGAGSEIDPNRYGPETQLASNRTEEKITGALDRGDSEITTEKTNEMTRQNASGARAAGFRPYEQLSREAIADENIPLAHRQTIRKYFEMIRPTEK